MTSLFSTLDFLAHSNLLNFAIAVAFLVWVFKRFKLGATLDTQQAKVVQSLQEAEKQRDAALKELNAIETRMNALSGEVAQLLSEAQQTAAEVAQTIIRNAQAEAEGIVANAQKRIELERKTMTRELEHRMMREAIHAATQLLENTLTPQDKQASVEAFIEALPDLATSATSKEV